MQITSCSRTARTAALLFRCRYVVWRLRIRSVGWKRLPGPLLRPNSPRQLRIRLPGFDPPGAWSLSPIRRTDADSLRRKRRPLMGGAHCGQRRTSLARLHGEGYRYVQRQPRLHRIDDSKHPQQPRATEALLRNCETWDPDQCRARFQCNLNRFHQSRRPRR